MSEMTDEQLAEYEEKMAGDDYSSSAPRKAKQFWPSAKRLLGLLAPYKAALTAVFVLHGLTFLRLKTAGELRESAHRVLLPVAAAATVLGAAFVLWTQLAHGKPWTWAVTAIALLGVVGGVAMVLRERAGIDIYRERRCDESEDKESIKNAWFYKISAQRWFGGRNDCGSTGSIHSRPRRAKRCA